MMVALWAAEAPFALGHALVMCVFIVVAAVGLFRGGCLPAVVAQLAAVRAGGACRPT